MVPAAALLAKAQRDRVADAMRWLRFYARQLPAFFLNPVFVWQWLRPLSGQAGACLRSRRKSGARMAGVLRAPFDGRWKVQRGGVEPADSHSWSLFSQRYACDFVGVGADGIRHRGDGRACDD